MSLALQASRPSLCQGARCACPWGARGPSCPPHPEAVYTAIAQVGAVGGHTVPVHTGGFSLSISGTQRAVGDTSPRAQSALPASGGALRAPGAGGDASPLAQSAVRVTPAARGLALLIQELVQEERCTRNCIVGHSAAYIELLIAGLWERALRLPPSPPVSAPLPANPAPQPTGGASICMRGVAWGLTSISELLRPENCIIAGYAPDHLGARPPPPNSQMG